MEYDYSKLLGRIVEIYGAQSKFSSALGLSGRSLSLKLNGKIDFKQNEISKACSLLKIDIADIPLYFFAPKSQRD